MSDENTSPGGVSDSGQGSMPLAPAGQGPQPLGSAADKAQEYFFEQQFDGDREPTRWKSKDELAKYLKEGTLRHREYTKKHMEFSEQQKSFEKQRADHETQLKDFMTLRTRYDGFDQFFKQRPDVLKRIVNEMRGQGQGSQEDVRSEMTRMITDLKKEMEDKEAQRQAEYQNEQYRKEIFESMGKKYDDFDQEEILSLMQEVEGFQSLPPKAAMEAFADLLYHSSKGRLTPAQIEEGMAKRLQKKQSAVAPMPGGGAAPRGNGKISGSHNEIAAALKGMR